MNAHNRRRIWIVISIAATLLVASALLLAPGALAQGTATAQPTTPSSTAAAPEEPGLVIVSVAKDGPAAQAGVKRGDILLEVDGTAVNTVADLKQALGDREAGAKITLVVMHGDDRRTLTATVAEGNRYPVLGLTPVGSPAADAARKLGALPLSKNVMIQQVTPSSPAATAGLQKGDEIVSVDGQAVDESHDLAALITAHKPGDAVKLMIRRAGEEREVQVTLGEKPNSQGVAYLGVTYGRGIALPDGKLAPFKFPGGLTGGVSGLVVSEAIAGGPAANAGLKEGDIITAVDGQSVTDLKALRTILDGRKPGDVLKLTVRRDGADQEISLTLGEDPQNSGKAYAGLRLGVVIEKRLDDAQPQTAPGGLRQKLEERLRTLPQKLQEIVPRSLNLPRMQGGQPL